MNQIHEEDWSKDSWARHSGVRPNVEGLEENIDSEKKPSIAPRGQIVVPPHLKKILGEV